MCVSKEKERERERERSKKVTGCTDIGIPSDWLTEDNICHRRCNGYFRKKK